MSCLNTVPQEYRLSVWRRSQRCRRVRSGQTVTFCGVQIFPLARTFVPDFTPRGQKLKSLPPLGHVHQLFQRYKEFLGIRRWRSSDLDTLLVRDSAMNSQTVASFVIPHVSASNPKRFANMVPENLNSIASSLDFHRGYYNVFSLIQKILR